MIIKKMRLTTIFFVLILTVGSAMGEEYKYSVLEIDALRFAVRDRYLFGTTTYPENPTSSTGITTSFSGWSTPAFDSDVSRVVEERVRTYMSAGIKARDLYEQDRQNRKIAEETEKETGQGPK